VTQIAVPFYEGMTPLDVIGPYEVLARLPGLEFNFVAARPGPVGVDASQLELVAEAGLDEVSKRDIVIVPGGPFSHDELDGDVIEWLREVHGTTTWTTSVCTGALLLGEAGILDGIEATTHWVELESLRRYGATPTRERVVEQGKVITAAGVSSGIDMGLVLASRLMGDVAAQAMQLVIEYDPDPPFDAGSEEKAPPEIVGAVRERVEALAREASRGA
jgi:transcriptional regulator GlxA family with amidase domain